MENLLENLVGNDLTFYEYNITYINNITCKNNTNINELIRVNHD